MTFPESYALLRHVELDGTGWRLKLYDTNTHDPKGRTVFAYEFGKTGQEPLFVGEDYKSAVMRSHADDSDETLRDLLGFLTLRPGDTDSDYFEHYTADQLDFCSCEAEELSMWSIEPEPGYPPMPLRDVAGDGSLSPAWPSVAELAEALGESAKGLDSDCHSEGCDGDDCNGCTDVRLQCQGDGWQIHTGSADYDQDHRGFWGANYLSADYSKADLLTLAQDLLDQAKDSWFSAH